MTARKPRRAFVALMTVLALFAAACGGDGDSTEQASDTTAARPTSVERLRLAGAGDFGLPSPFTHRAGRGFLRLTFLFDSLIWKDSTGNFVPLLATEWERSADGKEWRFTLRDGVKWHDGQPLTAEDVVFTFDYVLRGPGQQVATTVTFRPQIDAQVVAEGTNVVVFKLQQPYASFEEAIAGRTPILPKHVWSTVTDPAKFTEPAAVMGTGPYTLKSYDKATGAYQFIANDNYFLGKPYVRSVEFLPVPNEILALRQGEIDAASFGVTEEPTTDEPLEAFKPPKYQTLTEDGAWARLIHFNLTRGFPFDNRDFRQAWAYAIDRDDLVKRVLLGRGQAGSMGGLGPTHPYLVSDLPAYDVDVAKAKTLLDGIGMKDTDGDGFRQLPDGTKFSPELITNARLSSKPAELIKEYLRAVGIDIQIKSLESTAHDAAGAAGNYDVTLVGYANGLGGDPDFFRQRLSSKVQGKSFTRVYGFANETFEQAAAKQRVALDDAERKRQVQTMQRVVAEELPLLTLYVPDRIQIYDATVFDAWYFTPGELFGSLPQAENKLALVTGTKFAPAAPTP